MQKVGERSKHKMEQEQAAAIAKLQRALAAEIEQRTGRPEDTSGRNDDAD
jgi:hypothetical protein